MSLLRILQESSYVIEPSLDRTLLSIKNIMRIEGDMFEWQYGQGKWEFIIHVFFV